MKTTRLFRVLVSTLIAFTHLTATALVPSDMKFRFQVPTRAKDPDAARTGALTPEWDQRGFSDFGALIAKTKGDKILPSDWEKRPPTLWIYLPNKETYLANREELKREARRQFAESYPGITLKVQIKTLNAESGFRVAYRNTIERIQELRASAKGRPSVERKLDQMEAQATEAYEETSHFYEMRAGTAAWIKDSTALVRAAIVGGVRFAQTVPTTMHIGGLPLATSLFLIAFDASAEYFIVRYTQRLQRLFQKLPFQTRSPKLNEALSITQNIILNMITFNIGRSVIMQAVQHVAVPMDIGMPTGNTVLDIIKWTLGGSIIYVGFNKGYNRLIEKGWLSTSQIDVGLQIPGVGDAISPVLNTDPKLMWLRPFVFIPQWIFYAAVGALGYVAKRKSDRILAVDASIEDWEKEIFPEQPFSAMYAKPIRDETDYEAVVRAVHAQKESCAKDLSVAGESPTDPSGE